MSLDAPPSELTHAELLQRLRAGTLGVNIEPQAAARFVSARLLLPFVAVAVIGLAIALVLWGAIWIGLTVGLLGVLVPRLVKRSAVGFVHHQLMQDDEFFTDALRAGIVTIVDVAGRDAASPLESTRTARSRRDSPGPFPQDT